MLAIDHDVAGRVDFHDPFGDEKAQIFFLLRHFGIVVAVGLQNEGIGLIQRLEGVVRIAFLPELLGDLAELQGFIHQYLMALA